MVAVSVALVGWVAAAPIKNWLVGDSQQKMLTQKVARGDLVITVVEDGNVESSSNLDIKCEVAGGSVILWIVADGKQVKKGEKLVELDGSTIEDQINLQKITLEKAIAARIQVEKEFSAAKIAVQEYEEGTFVKEFQLFESQSKIAMENLRSAENSLQHTERMARKGYVTPLQLEAQRFAVERAKLDLSTADTARNVLAKFTKAKMIEELQSKRDSAEARWRAEQAACALEEKRLQRLQTQLDKCLVLAPQDGMVIYANEFSSRSSSPQVKIEEGASIRERQSILRLPDLSQMQVKMLVHESKIEQLAHGQRAEVTLLGRKYRGQVTIVANQPEPGSFFSSNVKEYAAYVQIQSEVVDVRPGMTAQVEVLVAEKSDVISVPVQAVVEQGRNTFCWVRTSAGVERRPVVIGSSNSERIEIRDGLAVGDELLLNPRAVVAEARETVLEDEKVDVDAKFGKAKDAGAAKSADGVAPSNKATDSTSTPPGKTGPRTTMPTFAERDKNGDGKIMIDEVDERMKSFFDRIDTNGDGAIDAKEYAAMRTRMQQQKQGGQSTPPQ